MDFFTSFTTDRNVLHSFHQSIRLGLIFIKRPISHFRQKCKFWPNAICTLRMRLFFLQLPENTFQAAQNEKEASGDVLIDIANVHVPSTADDTTLCTESSPSFQNSTIAGCTLQITVCLYLWTNTTQSLNMSTRHHGICSDSLKKELGFSSTSTSVIIQLGQPLGAFREKPWTAALPFSRGLPKTVRNSKKLLFLFKTVCTHPKTAFHFVFLNCTRSIDSLGHIDVYYLCEVNTISRVFSFSPFLVNRGLS